MKFGVPFHDLAQLEPAVLELSWVVDEVENGLAILGNKGTVG